jgi:hypothetical protein
MSCAPGPSLSFNLALQLHFLLQLKIGFLGCGLVCAAPEGPSDDARGLDAPLCEPGSYAADFLNGPADKRRNARISGCGLGWA